MYDDTEIVLEWLMTVKCRECESCTCCCTEIVCNLSSESTLGSFICCGFKMLVLLLLIEVKFIEFKLGNNEVEVYI